MADKIIHIPVGSGHLFHTSFTGTIPADSVIETPDNRIGYIEKGAEVDYKPTFKTFKDDLGLTSARGADGRGSHIQGIADCVGNVGFQRIRADGQGDGIPGAPHNQDRWHRECGR